MRLPRGELAKRISTSRTRLNSYLTGAVMPGAGVVEAIEQVAEQRRAMPVP